MGKALVINNANFETNSLDTINFNGIDCTDVSVSPSTISFTEGGETQELTVVKTPSDTTDSVVFETSNSDVVTVDGNGVVTCTGLGEATITVRCGNASATCAVSATSLEIGVGAEWSVGETNYYSTTEGQMVIIADAASKYMFAAKSIESGSTADVYYRNHTVYPLEIPLGSGQIKVTMDSYIGNRLQVGWFNSKSKPYTKFPSCIEGIEKVTGIFILQNGNVLTIPEGADRIIIAVQTNETQTQYADMTSVAEAANIKIYAETSAS